MINDTELMRFCPICKDKIFYKSKNGFNNAINNNSTCLKCCKNKNIEKPFKRNCPECNKEMSYKKIEYLIDAYDNDSLCHSCVNKHRHFSIDTRKKISDSNKGKKSWNKGMPKDEFFSYMSEESKKNVEENFFKKGERPKNADFRKGKTYIEIYGVEKAEELINNIKNRKLTKEHKENISSGILNSEKWKQSFTDERAKKISDALKGKKRNISDETMKKMRLRFARNNDKFVPTYNKNACLILNELALKTNTIIQHAENGGEYYIEDLGYWIDGYDVINNIVYEIDEPFHYDKNGYLKEKDIKRQLEIENLLNCKFIRIKINKENKVIL